MANTQRRDDKMMIVMRKQVGKQLELKAINYTLKDMQGLVGGLVEHVYLACKIVMVINEEGIPRNEPLNFYYSGKLINTSHVTPTFRAYPIFGDVFFASLNEDGSDLVSLDFKQIEIISKLFSDEHCIIVK